MSRIFVSILFAMALFVAGYSAEESDTAPWEVHDGFYPEQSENPECCRPCAEEEENCGQEEMGDESVSKEGSEETNEGFSEEEGSIPVEETATEEWPIEELSAAQVIPLDDLDHIIRRHAEQLTKISRLHWVGAKGINREKTDHVFVAYECYHALTVEQVRKLFVYATETLLKAINSLGITHPQLGHYPFVPDDLTVRIKFDNFFGQYVDRQYVKEVEMENSIVEYHSFSCGQYGKKCCSRKERYSDSVDQVRLNLQYADRFRQIKGERDVGTLLDQTIPFQGIFE